MFRRSTHKYGDTPTPETPYQKAAEEWDRRIGSARVQARNWRLMAFSSFWFAGGLASALIWQTSLTRITPYVVEVDKIGQVKNVGPAGKEYKPTDAQIAYHLGEFIKKVRSVSVDPVVLRQQWLDAYNYVTDRAAPILNEYARENDPFKQVGKRSVAVDITSVVRASDNSFQVKWIERHYMNGAFQRQERYTAILTIITQKPVTAEALSKNPLGLYVHGLNWSKDLDQGDK